MQDHLVFMIVGGALTLWMATLIWLFPTSKDEDPPGFRGSYTWFLDKLLWPVLFAAVLLFGFGLWEWFGEAVG